jgi:hypothetical protein
MTYTYHEECETRERVKQVREALDFIRRNAKDIPMALETMHRTEQQMFMKDVIVRAIHHWSDVYNDTDRVRYDGRNECTVMICDRIVKEIDNLDCLPLI